MDDLPTLGQCYSQLTYDEDEQMWWGPSLYGVEVDCPGCVKRFVHDGNCTGKVRQGGLVERLDAYIASQGFGGLPPYVLEALRLELAHQEPAAPELRETPDDGRASGDDGGVYPRRVLDE